MKSSITELQGMMGGEMGQSMQQLRQSAAGGEGQMRATLDLAKEMGSDISRQQEMRKARGAMLFQEYKKKMGMVQPDAAAAAQPRRRPHAGTAEDCGAVIHFRCAIGSTLSRVRGNGVKPIQRSSSIVFVNREFRKQRGTNYDSQRKNCFHASHSWPCSALEFGDGRTSSCRNMRGARKPTARRAVRRRPDQRPHRLRPPRGRRRTKSWRR